MEKKAIVVCGVVGFLGLLSAATGFAAEATRVKGSQVQVISDTQCSYPHSPAMALGLTSAMSLVIAQVIINFSSGCICCKRNPQPSNSNWTIALVCFCISWFTFIMAFLLLLTGAVLNDQHGEQSVYFSNYYCYVVKPGVFAGGALLSVATVILGMVYYLKLKAAKNGANQWGTSIPNQGSIALGQPQIPDQTTQDPVFVHEDACAPPTTTSTVLEYDGSYPNALLSSPTLNDHLDLDLDVEGFEQEQEQQQREEVGSVGERKRKERDRAGDQISILALLIAAFRKSLIGCSTDTAKLSAMEIGWPSEVRHVAHVTFDRFHGFLGLPVEFEPEVPRRPPSASASVFGVSTESMQLSFDARGNSVPTILLLMQRQLYAQGGLQAEGIFRINGENGQEEHVREHLNRGVVLEGIDVHCLAGLIKAWFRELPTGVLDSLSPEQVMQSQSEEECAQLVRLLPSTEAALLDWAINLMADVAQMEHLNKMDARNIAMVFAPNMTQMSDPLTALMYAVQVMNFLKTLVVKTLKERAESMIETSPPSRLEPFGDDEHQSSSQLVVKENNGDADRENESDTVVGVEEPSSQRPPLTFKSECDEEGGHQKFLTSVENVTPGGSWSLVDGCPCGVVSQFCSLTNGLHEGDSHAAATKPEQINICRSKSGHSGNSNLKKVNELGQVEKNRGTAIISRINSRTELVEAWR